jgi:hypothetical protein
MNANCRFTPEFIDELIRRLKAGEKPQALRAELGIGAASMERFEQFARSGR